MDGGYRPPWNCVRIQEFGTWQVAGSRTCIEATTCTPCLDQGSPGMERQSGRIRISMYSCSGYHVSTPVPSIYDCLVGTQR